MQEFFITYIMNIIEYDYIHRGISDPQLLRLQKTGETNATKHCRISFVIHENNAFSGTKEAS